MNPSRARIAMKATSETMKVWAEALRTELQVWPQVGLKRSFGMTFVYRGGLIFAALPGTHALYFEDAILLKFHSESPSLLKRIAAEAHFLPASMQPHRAGKGEGRKWRIFMMRSYLDLHAAVEWLAVAHRLTRMARKAQQEDA